MGGYSSLPQLIVPKAPDPVEQFGKLLQLKSLLAQQQSIPVQQQIQQEQLKQEQLNTQTAQQQVDDQKAYAAAFKQWDPSKPDELPGLLAKNGASGKAVGAAYAQSFQFKKDAAQAFKDQQQGNSAAFDALNKKVDLAAGHIDALKQLPDEQLPGAIIPTIKAATEQGLIPQEQADQFLQQAQQLAQLPPAQIRPAIDSMEKQLLGQKAILEKTAKDATIAEQQSATAKNNAETANLQQGGSQAVADSRYRNILMKQTQGQPVSADDAAFKKAYEKQKTLVPTATFNLQNALPGGQGGGPSIIAKGIADGSVKWQDVVSQRTPISVKQQLLAEVKQINPNFNSGDFDVEKKVREKYTSGNVSDQLLAINTAREHMQTFSKLADALNNGDVQALNKIGNAIGVQFGSDKKTNFQIAAQAFGGEVGKAFDGAGVVAGEREQAMKNFNADMSKGQFKGAIQTVDALLAGKQKAAKDSYEKGKQGQPNFGGTQTGQATTQSTTQSAPAANEKPVYVGGKLVGYTSDGKTMRPAQ